MSLPSSHLPRISTRAQNLSPPSIEDVLDQYSDLPNTANLAMGVAHWGPPPSALRAIRALGQDEEGKGREEAGAREAKKKLHGYGPIAGNADLVAALREKLETENQLDLTGTCACVFRLSMGLLVSAPLSVPLFLLYSVKGCTNSFLAPSPPLICRPASHGHGRRQPSLLPPRPRAL